MAQPAKIRATVSSVPGLQLLLAGLWLWAIWSCAEHWRGNPNYSYGWVVPVLALGFGLRRLFHDKSETTTMRDGAVSVGFGFALALVGGAIVFALEFAREQMWHPEIVLVAICLLAIGASLAAFCYSGGYNLMRAELFPVLFFLTAVPWPPRLEQPVTAALMRWVAGATAELLHWLGVQAETSGGAIALRSGLVGITEACSGVRSLQAGIMFGLALGEWFLLRPSRRIFLLGFAVIAALLTNLARTLALALQAEWHGIESVEKVHDLIGNIAITSLIVGIWIAGKLFASRQSNAEPSIALMKQRARSLLRNFLAPQRPLFVGLTSACLVAFVGARLIYGAMETRDRTQLAPFFAAHADASAGDQVVSVPREIWNELRPTSGEYFRRHDETLPRGIADFYHLFWKPSPWNRFVLVHRPDICMPGVGWEADGAPETVEIDFGGRAVRFHAFRFRREQYRALQLWGVWRNGEPVPLDFQPADVGGKSRSATEIVACTLFSEQSAPSIQIAVAQLRSLFQYNPQ